MLKKDGILIPGHTESVKESGDEFSGKSQGGGTENFSRLNDVYKFANESKLDKALENCNLYLNENTQSANASYLVGEINDSLELPQEAITYFRKLLYLNSNRIDALIYLSLMAEQRGDCNESILLRERAKNPGKELL